MTSQGPEFENYIWFSKNHDYDSGATSQRFKILNWIGLSWLNSKLFGPDCFGKPGEEYAESD